MSGTSTSPQEAPKVHRTGSAEPVSDKEACEEPVKTQRGSVVGGDMHHRSKRLSGPRIKQRSLNQSAPEFRDVLSACGGVSEVSGAQLLEVIHGESADVHPAAATIIYSTKHAVETK